MDKKIFKTLVKDNHKFGRNAYIRGKISGIQFMVCDINKTYANEGIEGGILYTCECTPEQYEKFTKIIEEHYPGLCIFNYEEESK